MKRPYFLIALFVFLTFLHSSNASETKSPYFPCSRIISAEPIASIKKYVEKEMKNLGGKNQFLEHYKSVHGLLHFASKLSNVTDNIDTILETVFNILGRSDFQRLDWPLLFSGTQKKLQDLVNGFLNKAGNLRKKGNDYQFFLDKNESFPISGEEGFDRFKTEISSGNKERAFLEATAVLNLPQLEALKWKRAYNLKAKNLLFEELEKNP